MYTHICHVYIYIYIYIHTHVYTHVYMCTCHFREPATSAPAEGPVYGLVLFHSLERFGSNPAMCIHSLLLAGIDNVRDIQTPTLE